MRLKHFLSVFLTLLTLSIGQVWGATVSVVAGTYTKQASVAVNGNGSYIFMFGTSSDAYVMQNSTNGSNYLGRSSQFTSLPNTITIATSPATNTSYFWSVTDYDSQNGTFKLCGPNGYCYCAGTGKLAANQNSSSTWHIATVSNVIYMIDANSCYVKNTGASGFRAYSTAGNRTQLVAVYKLESSYTIAAVSNNTNYGTVSLSNGVITATPAANCRIASTAYNVTNGTATVVRGSGDDINKFTVTPTSNCTVRINFEPIPKHTLNYHDGSGDGSKTNVYEGTNLITALGTPAASCDKTSTTFVGWTTTEITTKTDTKPTLVSADAVVNSTTAAAKYYAVYAKSNTGSWSLTSIDKLNNSSGYAGYNGSHTASGISYTSNQVMAQSSTIQFQSSAGYMYNTTAMSADITSIVITSSSTNWSVYTSSSSISSTPASGAISISSSGNTRTFTVSATGHKYFHIKGGASTPQATNITVNYGTTKDYITTCCTELGQINGSFF